MSGAVNDPRGLSREIESSVMQSGTRQRICNDNSSLRPQQFDQCAHSTRMDMHAIGDQFSIHFMGPSQRSKRARSAMKQGSHGIETVGDMRDAQFYGFLRLLICCIGMTHTDGDASIYQTAKHCRGSRQLRGECEKA